MVRKPSLWPSGDSQAGVKAIRAKHRESYSYPYAYSYPFDYGYAYSGPDQTACPQANGIPLYQIKLTYQNNVWLAQDYWYTEGTLNFITLQREQKKTPISSIDRALTLQLNRDCGVNFQLPR